MEIPGFLTDHLDAKYRDASPTGAVPAPRRLPRRLRRPSAPAGEAFDDSQIMLPKNWSALGSFLKQDRPRSLDLLGFASQLVFTTALLNFSACWRAARTTLAYAMARAHNRHMVDFCSVDRRLLATGYVPLPDFERTRRRRARRSTWAPRGC